jgi:hypothetical protein
MALPNKTVVQGLDFAFLGEPFVQIPAKAGIETGGLDVAFLGSPIFAATELAPVTASVNESGAHRYWRLRATAAVNASEVWIYEVEMRGSAGGADLCSGGTPFGENLSGGAASVFDNTTGDSPVWMTVGGTPLVIGYDFGADTAIVELGIFGYASSNDYLPSAWTFEFSDDNSTWQIAHTASGLTSGSYNQGAWTAFSGWADQSALAGESSSAASGSSASDSASESVSSSDSASVSVVGLASASEAAPGVDTPAAAATIPAGLLDSASASDSPAAVLTTVAEAMAPASAQDAPSGDQATSASPASEAATAGDAPSGALAAGASLSDAASATDALSALAGSVAEQGAAGSAADTSDSEKVSGTQAASVNESGAHRYWRLRATAAVNASEVWIYEVEMRGSPGGADLCSGGTPFGENLSGGAASAFDNTTGDSPVWMTVGGTPLVIGYDFGADTAIVELGIFGYAGSNDYLPSAWTFEFSDDNNAWQIAHTASGLTSGSYNQGAWTAFSGWAAGFALAAETSDGASVVVTSASVTEAASSDDLATAATASLASQDTALEALDLPTAVVLAEAVGAEAASAAASGDGAKSGPVSDGVAEAASASAASFGSCAAVAAASAAADSADSVMVSLAAVGTSNEAGSAIALLAASMASAAAIDAALASSEAGIAFVDGLARQDAPASLTDSSTAGFPLSSAVNESALAGDSAQADGYAAVLGQVACDRISLRPTVAGALFVADLLSAQFFAWPAILSDGVLLAPLLQAPCRVVPACLIDREVEL